MKKQILTMFTGLFIGAIITGGASAYAAGILAERSNHRIFVDGQEVQMEAYGIAGHNYVKLRDIGKAVGFNVFWDADSGCVQIETGAPYTGEAPSAEAVPPAAAPSDVDAAKQDIVARTNALRAERGIAALAADDQLMRAAQVRADEMAATGTYSHTRPDGRQYCAAKELDFDSISLTDMEQILRAGLTHLYSFSRTMEVRTVPAEEDGEEDTAETWYIYTIRYNGEAYFADTIFALTDEQKGLAENYAENLSLFLGDGLFQYAPSTNTIAALGDVRFTDGETEVIYFNQLDERYANQPYGTDHIGGYGCGPTSMAIVVSSLTSETVDPVQMARWAYEHGYWCSKSGSYHTLIPGAAQAWGLSVEGCTASEPQRILDALADGKLVVALMTKGHFTKSGHFIVLRGVQDEKILVADPASYRRSQKAWELSIILNEASRRAGAGGPFWIIG